MDREALSIRVSAHRSEFFYKGSHLSAAFVILWQTATMTNDSTNSYSNPPDNQPGSSPISQQPALSPDTPRTTDPETGVLSDQLNLLHQIEMEGYELAVKKARNALFWTAGLIFLSYLFAIARSPDPMNPIVIGFAVFVAGIFIALALWTKSKPYVALITGIITFAAYILLEMAANAMLEGATGAAKSLFGGIIFKVIIFVNLVRPLKDAKLLQEARKIKY